MLRARKKDARIKPNRKLDKRSSRGMLYENEELRLRTIEINAEVERGQTDIKKLRRENDHLRREMWALRDEYERLEKLIKHLDLAGTNSERQQQQRGGRGHSEGEDGHGGDTTADGRSSASVNGRATDSECSDDDDDHHRAASASRSRSRSRSRGESPAVLASSSMTKSKSQTMMMGVESMPARQMSGIGSGSSSMATTPMATAMAGSSTVTGSSPDLLFGSPQCQCHELQHSRRSSGNNAVYVECGNPDIDNMENYQKAYGRMPRRSSSAGGTSANKIYVSTQHFNPQQHQLGSPTSSPPFSMTVNNSSSSKARYESITTLNKGRLVYTSSGMEDEDGYAACSHPTGLLQLNSGCSLTNLSGGSPSFSPSPTEQLMHYTTSLVMIPPSSSPPPPPPSISIPASFKHVKAFRVAAAAAAASADRVTISSEDDRDEDDGDADEEEEDEEALLLPSSSAIGGVGIPLLAADTPGDDGHLNLDHLVQIVRSFQQEQELHQSGLAVVPTTAGMANSGSSSSDLSSPPPLPPPPLPPPLPPLLSTDVVIEEEDEEDLSSRDSATSPESNGMATIKRRPPPLAAIEQQLRNRQTSIIERDESSGCDEGQVIGALASANSVRRSSSSSICESPTASASVAYHNNNNNNNNSVNNNKKSTTGSGAEAVRPTSGPSSFSEVPLNRLIKPPIAPRPARLAAPVKAPVIVAATAAAAATDHGEFGHQLSGAGSTNCLSLYPLPDGDASAALLRLHAVDPFTVSFNVKDLPGTLASASRTARSDSSRPITVQEVIDQLEQQVDPTRCQVRGVRMLCVPATTAACSWSSISSMASESFTGTTLFFISVDSARSLHYLMRHPFRLRGQRVRLTDVSAQTWIVSLSGVPHYISDATVSLLLAAFGTIVGDVERRFYRGTDTGERLVRFRLKGLAKLPRHITVGGCRIQVRRVSPAPPTYAATTAASSDGGSLRGSVRSTHRRFKSSLTDDENLPSIVDLDSPVLQSTAATTGTISKTTVTAAVAAVGSTSSSTGSVTDGSKKTTPKIGRSFEYRSQLRVDLRMSTELPAPALMEDSSTSRTTPPSSCPVCEQQQIAHPLSVAAATNSKRLPSSSSTPPPLPPAMVIHRCRKHDATGASASGTPVVGQPSAAVGIVQGATPTASTSGVGVVQRESPPKSRASVNFDETIATSSGGGSGAGSRVPASGIVAGSGGTRGGLASSKGTTSSSSNGILRKSVSGDEGSVTATAASASSSGAAGPPAGAAGSSTAEGTNEGTTGNVASAIDGAGGNANGAKGAKKTARSFSLVDTFRSASSRERRANAKTDKVVRVETVIENASPANVEESGAVRTVVVRRDSVESSSRSSRSSRKSNELPWCGCWGNGCL